MSRLIHLRPIGGSTAVILPKRTIRSLGWDRGGVPLRAELARGGLLLKPDPILRDIAAALTPYREKIHQAIVYGSYVRAKGWDPKESDIDLFVIAEKGVEERASKALTRVFLKHLVPISPMFYTPEEARELEGGRYFREVFRTGVDLWTM